LLALVFLNRYTYFCVSYIIVISDRIGHTLFKFRIKVWRATYWFALIKPPIYVTFCCIIFIFKHGNFSFAILSDLPMPCQTKVRLHIWRQTLCTGVYDCQYIILYIKLCSTLNKKQKQKHCVPVNLFGGIDRVKTTNRLHHSFGYVIFITVLFTRLKETQYGAFRIT